MERYIKFMEELRKKRDDSSIIKLEELYKLFDINNNLKEDFKEQDKFYVKLDIAWEKTINNLLKHGLEYSPRNYVISIFVDNNPLFIRFILIKNDIGGGSYDATKSLITLKINNYNFLFDKELNNIIKQMFSHEFKHFLRDKELGKSSKKQKYIKNQNDDFSYVNSPSEFEAFETMLFNDIRYKSNFMNLANERKWYNLNDYNLKKEWFEWFINYIKEIKKDKTNFKGIYNYFINHLNEKNLRKLYKDLYEYLFGLVAEKGQEMLFSNMPKHIAKEKETLKNINDKNSNINNGDK